MVDGIKYIETVKQYFSFLTGEFDFRILRETENGNAFYKVEYSDAARIISISYENIEDYLQVIVYKLDHGKLPAYDDKKRTLHLSELNRRVLSEISKEEIEHNRKEFDLFAVNDTLSRQLLKSAKELRLVLKHWNLAIVLR